VEGDALDRAREGIQDRSLLTPLWSEHLVHAVRREEFPASLTLSLDAIADEVGCLAISSQGAAGG
jgi:hypothetical protein